MRKHIPETQHKEPSPVPPRLALTIDEAAQSCTVSKSKIYELMKSGQLHFLKIGSRRLILVSALEAFLNRLAGVTE